MSILPTSLQVTNGANSLNPAQAGMIPRVRHVMTRAEFDANGTGGGAVGAERGFITSLGAGGWINGEQIELVDEVGIIKWFRATGGSNAANAAASHGRNRTLPGGKEVLLVGEANTLTAVATPGVAPTTGGAENDIQFDPSLLVTYTKGVSAWGLAEIGRAHV